MKKIYDKKDPRKPRLDQDAINAKTCEAPNKVHALSSTSIR